MSGPKKIYLFVHVIWMVRDRKKLLGKPIRRVLFANMQKRGEEKGIRIIAINGAEDHVHGLLQLHPAQNLLQVVNVIKAESSQWLNENKLLQQEFEWGEEYAAYSVSPSAVIQVGDYIDKQEEYHKTKSLEKELEVFQSLHLPD